MGANGRRRVVLAMSGGVDSSVAASLLQDQGHEVIGLFMRTGTHAQSIERRVKTCCSASDALDARAVADRLDLPFYALDFEDEFARIMDDFADEYLAGRTPNPCVRCNVWLKFGKLWDYGRQVGADFVATGHYARIAHDAHGRPRIARGVDRAKDQSYVLAGLEADVLPHVLLPIGGFRKEEVRERALELGMPVHDKPDSQEICFIPDHDTAGFVRGRRAGRETSGVVLTQEGRELGRHGGIEAFTIGQRRGLGVATSGVPQYVVHIEPATRAVTIGPRSALERGGLESSRFVWHVPTPDGPTPCLAQVRSRHTAVPAMVEPLDDGRARVRFDAPQSAIAPGQLVAVYEGDLLLGGGWIDHSID